MSQIKDREQEAQLKAPPQVVRLSINLAPDVAAILRNWAERKAISATEAIRRAIAVWNFIETEKSKGNRIVVIEGSGNTQVMREIVLID